MVSTDLVIPVVLAIVALVVVMSAYVLPRARRKPGPVAGALPEEMAVTIASSDAVMRALKLVQQQYAALVRQHDAAQARIRDLEDEVERLRTRR